MSSCVSYCCRDPIIDSYDMENLQCECDVKGIINEGTCLNTCPLCCLITSCNTDESNCGICCSGLCCTQTKEISDGTLSWILCCFLCNCLTIFSKVNEVTFLRYGIIDLLSCFFVVAKDNILELCGCNFCCVSCSCGKKQSMKNNPIFCFLSLCKSGCGCASESDIINV